MSEKFVAEEPAPAGDAGTVRSEEFKVSGDGLLAKVKELMHEGCVRRITIKNEQGVTLLVLPLAWGLVGAALWPVWAAIGAMAALVTSCTILVERVE